MNAYTGQVPETLRAPDWRTKAACRAKGVDPDAMFPGDTKDAIADAKAICRRCPVWRDCLADALRTGDNEHGIRGGLKPCERRALAREKAFRSGQRPEPEAVAS